MDFSKAKESLDASELCLGAGLYNACANRAYYAMFQSAVAALERQGFQRNTWSHPGLQRTFTQELVHRRKLCPNQFSTYLHKGLYWRNMADYSDTDISKKRAEQLLNWARNFVSKIEEMIS